MKGLDDSVTKLPKHSPDEKIWRASSRQARTIFQKWLWTPGMHLTKHLPADHAIYKGPAMHPSNHFVLRMGIIVAIFLSTTIAAEEPPAKSHEAPAPPGYSLSHTGGRSDFDFLVGAWTTVQRRLKARGVGSTEWKDSPPNMHCATHYLDGAVTVEESISPAKTAAGLFIYTFDAEKQQWSLYWISPKSGKLDAPLLGGFDGSRGEFYGEDVDDGRPVKVRYSWVIEDRNHARWEQAFSFDNRSWETNWTTEFTRTEQAKQCQRSN